MYQPASNMRLQKILLSIAFLFIANAIFAQTIVDTSANVVVATDQLINATASTDSLFHNPRKATFRSAVLPGWGQAYNKEYWKIPLVYGVIGVPAGFFVYNNTWYKRSKKAYEIRIIKDSANFSKIHSKLQGLDAESLRFYRNQFRRDRDYSILYTLIAWGLNVADATVFAHLKGFDVSDDLSFKIKPGYSPLAATSGISLVLAIRNKSAF